MATPPRPLDDMPDRAIARRASAARGEVLDRSAADHLPEDGPSPDDLERFGGVTQPCWRCGTELYDDATTCWNCQASVGPGSGPRSGLPIWAVALAVLVALGILALAIL